MNAGELIVQADVPAASPLMAAFSALAGMSDNEFNRQVELMQLAQARASQIKRALMTNNVHYGVIPGTDKPTLMKPGAEVLLQAFGFAASYLTDVQNGDGITTPPFRVITRCLIHIGTTDGPVVAEGIAEANVWEKKHRRRRGQKVCPSCGKSTIGRSKAEYGGGYYCNGKAGGCGEKWNKGSEIAAMLDATDAGEVDNPDPHDLANTIVKMSKKRALIDASLTATCSSGLFTQDMEDMVGDDTESRPRSSGKSAPAAVDPVKVLLNALAELTEEQKDYAKAHCAAKKGKLTPRWLADNPAEMAALQAWVAAGAPIVPAPVAAEPETPVDGPVAEAHQWLDAQGNPTNEDPFRLEVSLSDEVPARRLIGGVQ